MLLTFSTKTFIENVNKKVPSIPKIVMIWDKLSLSVVLFKMTVTTWRNSNVHSPYLVSNLRRVLLDVLIIYHFHHTRKYERLPSLVAPPKYKGTTWLCDKTDCQTTYNSDDVICSHYYYPVDLSSRSGNIMYSISYWFGVRSQWMWYYCPQDLIDPDTN